MTRVPKHIVEHYGSAHIFRSRARMLTRELDRILGKLRLGCAFFPCGMEPIQEIQKQIKHIRAEISVKNWGR